jgi:hypothetical protein
VVYRAAVEECSAGAQSGLELGVAGGRQKRAGSHWSLSGKHDCSPATTIAGFEFKPMPLGGKPRLHPGKICWFLRHAPSTHHVADSYPPGTGTETVSRLTVRSAA